MQVDPTTLLLVSFLTGILLPFVLLGLSRSTESDEAVGTWTRASLVFASGLVLLMLRGAIPDVISIAVGNTLLFLGYAELHQGFRIFFGRSANRTVQWVACVLYPAVLLLFLSGSLAFEVRVVLASLFLSGASLAIGRELLAASGRIRAQEQEKINGDRLVFTAIGMAFAGNSMLLIARGVVFLEAVIQGSALGPQSQWYTLSYLMAIFVNFSLAAGLPLIVSRRTQRELIASESSLLKVQQVGRVGYACLDTSTKRITVNDVLREMLGMSPQLEVTLDIWESLFHPDDLAGVMYAATMGQRGELLPEAQECRVFRYSDRMEFWIAISSQVQRDSVDGHPIILSIARDINRIKLSELSALRGKDEAEQSNKTKSQFLANMSHEIRTPMNAILGMLNLLERTELTHRQRDYATKAEGAAKSLLGLLNDILDFSKVDAGKMTLESQPFRLDTLMRNLAVVLSSSVKSKSIDILFDIDPHLPAVLMGDALRLGQILINLGGNAVKFTESGQVVVGLQCQSVNEGVALIRFSIQDSGIGIAPEHQQRIFDAFSQAEASTTRRFGGTGLGLAISKSLVDVMGGTLQLQSTPGEGTTFSFQIPFPLATESAEQQPAPLKSSSAFRRALVVDDNPIAGTLHLKILQSLGCEADWVESAEEALAKVKAALRVSDHEFPYSLVLMDWQMPVMDGWEATRQLREIAATCMGVRPIIIMLSANGRQDLAHRSGEEQALVDGYVVKPVTASLIVDAVMDVASENPGIRRMTSHRASKRQLAGMRVLVVEDNLINQQVAEELLSNEGAIVSLTANGQLGVDAVRAAVPQFDVVLMDIQMPVMDGYAATSVIRNELGLKALPIIAMTANAMAGDREACMAAGMNDHIGKPFDMAMLTSLLIRTTGHEAPAEAQANTPWAGQVQRRSVVNVEGLDFAAALGRMSGSDALYLRVARDFLKVLPTLHAELVDMLRADYRQKAVMALHTLKGNAGTLGVMELAHEAHRLEVLCKTDGATDKLLQEASGLPTQIDRAKSLLEHAVAQLGGETLAPDFQPLAQGADLARAIAKLAVFLEQSDMEAMQMFAENRQQLECLPEGFFDKLDAALQDMDFQTAHQTCIAALEKMNA